MSAKEDLAIRAVLQGWAAATAAKDADGALSAYAADVVRYDLAPPLATEGTMALDRATLEAWFASWQGPIGFELHRVRVASEGSLALCHGFLLISGTKIDGQETEVWTRLTLELRRTGGAWRIMHEHVSVPFYMDGSLRAAVDLRP
jgi:PhnB protein